MSFDNGSLPERLNQQLPPGVYTARSLVVPEIQANSFGNLTMQLRITGLKSSVSRRGAPYTRLYLGNSEGSIVGIAWHDNFLPMESTLVHGQVMEFTGKVRNWKGQSLLNLRRIETVDAADLSPSALLPVEWVRPGFRPALATILQSWTDIGNRHVRIFLADVFRDSSSAIGFLNCPAGKFYHHAYQGGLLQHTAEMLVSLRDTTLYEVPSLERDIAIALVIIHDLGKTLTLVGNRYNARGGHQPHEMATLELLAEPLRCLERQLPMAANLIRGYFNPKNCYPANKHRLYTEVSRLDRASAEGNHKLSRSKGARHAIPR